MRIEIQDIATGQSLHSEVLHAAAGETAEGVAREVLANQNVNDTEPETIQVAVWLDSDLGDTTPDTVLTGQAA